MGCSYAGSDHILAAYSGVRPQVSTFDNPSEKPHICDTISLNGTIFATLPINSQLLILRFLLPLKHISKSCSGILNYFFHNFLD